jgi:hypothetical protein
MKRRRELSSECVSAVDWVIHVAAMSRLSCGDMDKEQEPLKERVDLIELLNLPCAAPQTPPVAR